MANVLMLALGLATTFRVNEVIETIEEFVEDSPEARQDDINDNIPAVFAATLGASLLANVLFGGSVSVEPTLNKIGINFHLDPFLNFLIKHFNASYIDNWRIQRVRKACNYLQY